MGHDRGEDRARGVEVSDYMNRLSIDRVRALVARHAAVLSEADARLIARHLAEVDQLLLVVVAIVRRAVLRGEPVASQALEVGGHVRVDERGGR